MGNRLQEFELNTFYHVFNRGCNKQQIFFEESDYERFLNDINQYKKKYSQIRIMAYCVLPNHFHLLIIEDDIKTKNKKEFFLSEPSKQISIFMQNLQLSYAMYFNAKYGKKIKKGLKAPLFEGRFKSLIILDEEYLSEVVTYIELNAVKHELVLDPKDWSYSSYEKVLNKIVIPDIFDSNDFFG